MCEKMKVTNVAQKNTMPNGAKTNLKKTILMKPNLTHVTQI
jgi:hypothetical protein